MDTSADRRSEEGQGPYRAVEPMMMMIVLELESSTAV
jgi:hypothetical protein